jgi:hypothetical protein
MKPGQIAHLAQLANSIEHVSQLITDPWRPPGDDWAPWSKAFGGNYPRVMPRISADVVKAQELIEQNDHLGFGEAPFEFVLTVYLHQFWIEVDEALATVSPQSVDDFLLPASMYSSLMKGAEQRVPNWSFQHEEGGMTLCLIHEEPVVMMGGQKEGLVVGPATWRWPDPATRKPKLVPLKAGGLLPWELLDSEAGLPIFLDAIRRASKACRQKFGYCSNCCSRTHKSDLYGGHCPACAGVIY